MSILLNPCIYLSGFLARVQVEGENLTFTNKIEFLPPSIGYVYVAEKENKSQIIIYIGETTNSFGRFNNVKNRGREYRNGGQITNYRINTAIYELITKDYQINVYFFIPSNIDKIQDFDITIPSKQIETKLFELYEEKHREKPFINNFRLPIEKDYKTKWEEKIEEFIGSTKCLKT